MGLRLGNLRDLSHLVHQALKLDTEGVVAATGLSGSLSRRATEQRLHDGESLFSRPKLQHELSFPYRLLCQAAEVISEFSLSGGDVRTRIGDDSLDALLGPTQRLSDGANGQPQFSKLLHDLINAHNISGDATGGVGVRHLLPDLSLAWDLS